MKEILQFCVNNLPLIVGFLGLLGNAIYAIVVIVKNTIKRIKKGEEIAPTMEQTYLELKELARKYIYEKEALFKNVALGGVKSGAFKLDSVLSSIESECLRRNVAYDSFYWTDYVNKEVQLMKGVK